MATKKKHKKKKTGVSVTIRNEPTRKKHKKKKGAKKNPKKHGRRRRRNPPDTLMSRVLKIGALAGVALLSGVVTVYGQAKIKPGTAPSLYGVPAAMALGGVLLMPHSPTIGTGMAIGALAGPFTLPLASRALTPSTSTSSATTAAAAAVAGLDDGSIAAVEMGDEFYHALQAVTMGGQHRHMQAVEVGAVDVGDYEDDDDDEAVDYDEGGDEYEYDTGT